MPTLIELARRLNAPGPSRRWPPLLLLTDALRLADPLPAAARLPRGAGVILRHYGAPGRAALAAALARLCRARGLTLIVAGDAGLAQAVRAGGLHLPEGSRPPRGLRRRGFLLTVAAHSLPALRRAKAMGADAALLAPVFATASHPGAPTLGPLRFAALARAAGLPVYALGGITAAGAARLQHAGAVGFAAIGALSGESGRR